MATTALDTHNSVTAQELEKMLGILLNTAKNQPEKCRDLPPLLIWGSPGLGKSTIVRDIATSLGMQYIDVRLAQMEPCDIRGLPVPDKEAKKMRWFVNGTWPDGIDENGKPTQGIIFLDEISACDRSVQVAAYELVLERRLGDLYKVPDGWYICAAGNTVTDKAVANTLSSALANRFLHTQLIVDLDSWLSWARSNNIHPSVIGFVQFRPALLMHMEHENTERGWPSPRSWHRVSEIIHNFESSEINDEVLMSKMIYGLVGNGAGMEFMSFYKTNLEFQNVLDIMRNPNMKFEIPDDNHPDRKFAMVSAMVYNLWSIVGSNTNENQLTKDIKNELALRMDGFLRICIEFSSDFACLSIAAAVDGKDSEVRRFHCTMLLNHPRYEEWKTKHQEALSSRKNLFKF